MKKQYFYKLFTIVDGKPRSLYVNAGEDIPVGEFISATEPDPNAKGKIDSTIGPLHYRPGWHLSSLPCAKHIGKNDGKGGHLQRADSAWFRCLVVGNEIPCTKRYGFSHLPMEDGKPAWYRYKTNPNADDHIDWIIASQIMLVKKLTNEEVDRLCLEAGVQPQERE